jgi:hypothetical protein
MHRKCALNFACLRVTFCGKYNSRCIIKIRFQLLLSTIKCLQIIFCSLFSSSGKEFPTKFSRKPLLNKSSKPFCLKPARGPLRNVSCQTLGTDIRYLRRGGWEIFLCMIFFHKIFRKIFFLYHSCARYFFKDTLKIFSRKVR